MAIYHHMEMRMLRYNSVICKSKRWRQPKCSPVDEWNRNVVYAYSELLRHGGEEALCTRTIEGTLALHVNPETGSGLDYQEMVERASEYRGESPRFGVSC